MDLENRLIDFSVLIIAVVEELSTSKAGNHLAGQLVRSGTSVSLNYGEARSAESTRDFIHKMKVVLKELRESHNCLRIIKKAGLCANVQITDNALQENDELIAIFVASIVTAQRNNGRTNNS